MFGLLDRTKFNKSRSLYYVSVAHYEEQAWKAKSLQFLLCRRVHVVGVFFAKFRSLFNSCVSLQAMSLFLHTGECSPQILHSCSDGHTSTRADLRPHNINMLCITEVEGNNEEVICTVKRTSLNVSKILFNDSVKCTCLAYEILRINQHNSQIMRS